MQTACWLSWLRIQVLERTSRLRSRTTKIGIRTSIEWLPKSRSSKQKTTFTELDFQPRTPSRFIVKSYIHSMWNHQSRFPQLLINWTPKSNSWFAISSTTPRLGWREISRQRKTSWKIRWKKCRTKWWVNCTAPGLRSRSKTAQDMGGLSGFPARLERFGRFERFFFR